MKNNLPRILLFVIVALIVSIILNQRIALFKLNTLPVPQEIANKYSPAPTSLPSPSPRPLTFSEMNQLYGPCVHLPVLYYHHIQNLDVAKAEGQQNLTVGTSIFISQMQYLKDHGYNPVASNSLTDFFDRGIPVPDKSVILTFDDGYEDFFINVLPILKQFGFKGIIALPTGLVGNPGYVTWDEISQAAGSNIEIVNHTWSHANLKSGTQSVVISEISIADSQLATRGYNQNKVFVYPYGSVSNFAENFLQSKSYTLAFTTVSGSTLCKKQRLSLPRIRIGNTNLSSYGF